MKSGSFCILFLEVEPVFLPIMPSDFGFLNPQISPSYFEVGCKIYVQNVPDDAMIPPPT